MQYRAFGNTGVQISALGFGAMRLPEFEQDGKWYIDEEKAIPLLHRAFDLGVNYVDTAWGYCHENSQYTVGKALKGHRDNVYLSTKLPIWNMKKEDDFWYLLEEQLKRLDVDVIDFYHIHALNNDFFEQKVIPLRMMENMEKAKQQGLIRHKSFSFHDKPEVLKKIIDTGAFETVLCQYNLLDRDNEDMLAYAQQKGIGTVTMGPVAGGRLAVTSEVLKNMVGDAAGTPEIALRFVLANKNVNCALSGMENLDMLEENAAVASREDDLSPEEWMRISDTLEQTKAMSDLYCSGCDYCQPCPKDIQISKVFYLYNLHKVYGITEFAKKEFARLGSGKSDTGEQWGEGKPSDCIECGVCMKKCPQFIQIPEQLKAAVSHLG